jgi:sulfonate transport system substrate-binding protein
VVTIKIGGVPEHFNLPWQLAIEQQLFEKQNIRVDWNYYAGGTGEMVAALKNNELDLAILLTEGFLSAVSKGLQAVVVKEYISSPLVWGIFTGSHSGIKSVYDESAKKIAISRPGSGSHLMALIHAEQRGESITDYELVEIKSLQGAVHSLVNNETDLFYWEKYTTKAHVESGELKMIGEFSAPWSSFLVTANKSILAEKGEQILTVLALMNDFCIDFVKDFNSTIELQKRFHLTEAEVKTWLAQTIWNTSFSLRKQGLRNAIDSLQKIDASFAIPDYNSFVAEHILLR